MEFQVQEVLALLIPIVAIIMGIGIGMLSLLLDYRKKREIFALHHKERLAAIERGMDLPPLPAEFFQSHRGGCRAAGDFLRRGLVWLLVGLAVTVALYNSQRNAYLWGLVPAALGVANLLYYYLAARAAPSSSDTTGGRPDAPR